MAFKPAHWLLFTIHLLCAATSSFAQATDPEILLKFKESLTNATRLNWRTDNAPICDGGNTTSNWSGLICINGNVVGLRLEGMGLAGKIDVEMLSQLSYLRVLSMTNNNFAGQLPAVHKLRWLRYLSLSDNRFTGEIPDGEFSGMKAIRRVLLAGNEFTGRIPTSLTELNELLKLQLQNNLFNGPIPDFPQESAVLNFANNRLEGPIPPNLSSRNESIFAGNPNLCGKPLKPCP